ncbi:MAG: UDP-N-acetylmuramoyl-L-alanine--D-glutamate ligase [Alphaproteobacteria bacterium]
MIVPPHVKGKSYVVLGLGKSGMQSARSLIAGGAHVLAWDNAEPTRKAAEEAGISLMNPDGLDWTNIAALVLSPGIPQTHPVAAKAKAAGIAVIGDIELLFQSQPEARYVGITGTNGKSTTTALIGHILKTAGLRAEIGGNLGTPALALAPLGKDGIYVLELSSYQLDLIRRNPIEIAVMLNLTPDHLARHGDMAGYIAAKARIIRDDGPQTFICGMDDDHSRKLAERASAKPGIRVQGISQAAQEGCAVYAKDRRLIDNIGGKHESILGLDTLTTLVGAHNWQNIAAAYAAATALGVPRDAILAGVKTFPGLAHRQQLIAAIDGVKFINDSKATNADATGKALACYDPIYLILGGQPKEGGLAGLEIFMPRVRHAFLIGQAADEFAAWLEGKAAYAQCGTLDVAVAEAASMAWREKLDHAAVLLSPACASWDQFSSFEHRGDMFARYVRALQSPALGQSA